MTINDLVAACEKGFASIRSAKSGGAELSSGGPDEYREPACLYATEALAMAAWLKEFDWAKGCQDCNGLIWVEKPYVETYRITLGDSYGTYRIVRDRYVVRGTVAFETVESEPETPEEVIAKPKRKAKAA